MDFISQFVKDVLSVPAVLVGLAALVGLLAQGKGFSEIVNGTAKSTLGFLILVAGAGTLIGSLDKLGPLLEQGFGVKGVVPNNEAVVAIAQQTLGTETALIMVFGFIANLLYARFTPYKYVFLTGHHTFYMAALLSAVLGTAGLTGAVLVVTGALILGALMVGMPALASPYMRQVVGGDQIALGHFGTLGYWLSGWIGQRVGDRADSIERYQPPKSLAFFRDSLVSTGFVMFLIFLIAALAAGTANVERLSGGQNLLVFALIQGLTFAAGVAIILQGVRMIIGELVPAFQGIAQKIVPDARPALDCPVTFPYAPTAVLAGFVCSFAGGLISMLLLGAMGLAVIVPGLVPHFFVGGTAGVFGNATGGKRGCVIGSFVNGILISFGAAFLLPTLGALGFQNTTFGDSDFQWVGIVIGNLGNMLKGSQVALAAVLIVILLAVFAAGTLGGRARKGSVGRAA